MSARLPISSERAEPVRDSRAALAESSQTAFPALLVPPQPAGRDESSGTSRFRRITRIPSWVRGRASEASTPSTSSTAAPRQHVRSTPQPTPPSPTILIPPAPSAPPPSLPVHPRASRMSFGIGSVLTEPRKWSNSPQNLPPSPSDPRRRSLSSPSSETPRFRHSGSITPRPPIVSSSWDDNKLPSKHQSLPLAGPATHSTSSDGTLDSASTSTAASSEGHMSPLDHPTTPSGRRRTVPGIESRTDTISKLDFVSHFEAITQLNLKMESEEELTAEELGRALKYLFSRYHGVLDSVGEFKAQLDGENAELRAQINDLQQQLQDNNAEVRRLKSLLADHGISGRLSSESTDTVRGPSTSAARSAVSPLSPLLPPSRRPGSPGPPPKMALPPLPPFPSKADPNPALIDAQRYLSRAPLPPAPPVEYEQFPPSDSEPRAI